MKLFYKVRAWLWERGLVKIRCNDCEVRLANKAWSEHYRTCHLSKVSDVGMSNRYITVNIT